MTMMTTWLVDILGVFFYFMNAKVIRNAFLTFLKFYATSSEIIWKFWVVGGNCASILRHDIKNGLIYREGNLLQVTLSVASPWLEHLTLGGFIKTEIYTLSVLSSVHFYSCGLDEDQATFYWPL